MLPLAGSYTPPRTTVNILIYVSCWGVRPDQHTHLHLLSVLYFLLLPASVLLAFVGVDFLGVLR